MVWRVPPERYQSEHMAALARLGPTPLHRRNWSPVAQQMLPLELAGTLDERLPLGGNGLSLAAE